MEFTPCLNKNSDGSSYQAVSIFSVGHKVGKETEQEGLGEGKGWIITWRGWRGEINE